MRRAQTPLHARMRAPGGLGNSAKFYFLFYFSFYFLFSRHAHPNRCAGPLARCQILPYPHYLLQLPTRTAFSSIPPQSLTHLAATTPNTAPPSCPLVLALGAPTCHAWKFATPPDRYSPNAEHCVAVPPIDPRHPLINGTARTATVPTVPQRPSQPPRWVAYAPQRPPPHNPCTVSWRFAAVTQRPILADPHTMATRRKARPTTGAPSPPHFPFMIVRAKEALLYCHHQHLPSRSPPDERRRSAASTLRRVAIFETQRVALPAYAAARKNPTPLPYPVAGSLGHLTRPSRSLTKRSAMTLWPIPRCASRAMTSSPPPRILPIRWRAEPTSLHPEYTSSWPLWSPQPLAGRPAHWPPTPPQPQHRSPTLANNPAPRR